MGSLGLFKTLSGSKRFAGIPKDSVGFFIISRDRLRLQKMLLDP